MSFKDIKGQDKAILFLKGAIENRKVSHAYIFLGPSGVGKKLASINFAKALNCETKTPEMPCDLCGPCKKIDSGNHPDVVSLSPDKEGGALKIDKIRALIRDIALKPYEGRKKVYVIDEAASMTQEASNSLLKTLEEPPSESVMILIVDNISEILKTIASRAQIVKFDPISVAQIKTILMERCGIDAVRAHVLSHLSSGRLGEAIRYQGEGMFDKRARVIDGLANRTFFNSDFDDLTKEDVRLYLDIMLTWYRDILVAKTAPATQGLFVNVDRVDHIFREAKVSRLDHLENIINRIISAGAFLEQNANPKLVMAVLGLKIQGH